MNMRFGPGPGGPGGWYGFGPGGPGGPGFGPGGPGGPFFFKARRGGRARRGDVRAAALLLLGERPMHGYEMIQELESRTEGVWRPSPGSVYPTLQMLEDEGLVTASEADGKRLFALTEAGRAEAAKAAEGPTPWDQVTQGVDPTALELNRTGWGVLSAAKQVVAVGTDEQKARAIEVLAETRRRLYGILAETPSAT
ncbi:MAG TPA: PadR family transcriptional regulator [Acidimicrobiia bacterium]|nr:PadR family transcriptional regulator [Acidimicrobiia bacterium]